MIKQILTKIYILFAAFGVFSAVLITARIIRGGGNPERYFILVLGVLETVFSKKAINIMKGEKSK